MVLWILSLLMISLFFALPEGTRTPGAPSFQELTKKLIRENFASLKKVLIFAPDLETNQMVDVAQLVRVEDCGS